MIRVTIVVTLAVVFTADTLTPRGIAVWLFYLVPLLLSAWVQPQFDPFALAAICTALTILGYFLAPPGVLEQIVIVNRSLGTAVFWITAWILAQRARVKKALERESTLLRRIIDNIPDSIYARDRDNRFVLANAAVARRMGVPDPTALIGKSDADFFDAANAAKFATDDREVFAGRAKINYEEVNDQPNGQRRVILGTKVPLRDASGAVVGLIGIGRDITERKQAEASLRESEARLRSVLDGLGPHIFVGLTTLDGVALLANRPAFEAAGLQPEDVLGVHVDESFWWSHAPRVQARIRDAIERAARGELLRFDERARMADGQLAWMDVSIQPLRNEGGEIVFLIVSAHTIDERKRAEESLRDAHDRLAKIIATAPGVVCSFQLWPDGSARMPYGADRMEELLGVARGTLSADASAIFSLGHPDDIGRWQETVAESARTLTPWRHEWRMRHPVRGEIWLEGHSVPQREPDGSTLWHGVVSDITERKRADEALRELLARLHHAREEERTRIARDLHDELGQLLTGLKMDLRWLERKLSDPAQPPQLDALLDRVVEASALADSTIATVQRLAAELRPAVLDHLGIAAALVQHGRGFQERSGVRCAVRAPDSLPALPPAVAGELFSICREALTNVARHAQATQVEIELRHEGGELVLELRDDGIGLGEAVIQAPASLGLLGLKERAALCGGTLRFGQAEPRGTVVTVRIPLRAEEEP